MGWLNQLFAQVFRAFNWFYTVVPWERAVRVRLGKYVRVMGPGIHIQIPFVDKVYLCNIRDRIHATSPQTLTTKDGHTITLQACLRYSIVDVLPLYNRLHQAADTVAQEVEGRISRYVIHNTLAQVTPDLLSENVLSQVDLSEYGLECTDVFLTDFVRVKTYRFIQGGLERYTHGHIDTSRERKGRDIYD